MATVRLLILMVESVHQFLHSSSVFTSRLITRATFVAKRRTYALLKNDAAQKLYKLGDGAIVSSKVASRRLQSSYSTCSYDTIRYEMLF